MTDLLDDPIRELLEREKPSARVIPDPLNGYDRIVLDADLLDEIGKTYAKSIRDEERAKEKINKEVVDNHLVYECISDNGEVVTVPVAKRIANQQIGWGSTAILDKDPYITVKALDGGSYQLPTQAYEGDFIAGFEGLGKIPTYDTEEVSGEDAAKLYERLLQYDLTQLIDFEQIVEDTEFAIHVGENPTWWKIPYDSKVRHAKRRGMREMPSDNGKRKIQFFGVEDAEYADGKTVDIQHVYGPNVTLSPGDNNEQTAWWLAEKTPLTNIDLWEGFQKGIYDLCLPPDKNGKTQEVPQDEILKILGFAEDLRNTDDLALMMMQVDQLVAQNPRREHEVRTVWCYHPIRTDQGIEIRSLCGTLHLKSEKFLNLYVNPYWHTKRPYVPFFMKKRPHRMSGYSTVGDVAPLQRLMSNMFHLQVNNGVQQNMKVFLVRENSATWRWMAKPQFELKPGVMIPYENIDDVSPHQLGTQIQSMANEISFLDNTADKLTVSRDYARIPNRTAAATVAQIDANANVQPSTVLRSVRRSIAKAIKMYFQTVAQFHAYRRIPFLDPDTNRLITTLIGFPRDVIENQFSFRVTATGDDDTRQAKQERTLLNLVQTDKRNEAAMKLMDIILDPKVPEEAKDFATFCLMRGERLYGDLMEIARLDRSRFALSEQLVKKLRESVKTTAAQAPPEPPPPAPPPQAKLSFSAILPTEIAMQIIAAEYPSLQMPSAPPAAPQGAAPNAPAQPQLPPAGPAGTVPQLPPGGPGPPLVPGQPGGAGVPLQNAPPNPEQGGSPA